MINQLLNGYECENSHNDSEILNSSEYDRRFEDLLSEWFSPDYLFE